MSSQVKGGKSIHKLVKRDDSMISDNSSAFSITKGSSISKQIKTSFNVPSESFCDKAEKKASIEIVPVPRTNRELFTSY
jgi:hypothetical protein